MQPRSGSEHSAAPLLLWDAHCHLADARLAHCAAGIAAEARSAGVRHAVVNGTCQGDWASVAALAAAAPHGVLLPAFGLHPWRVADASPGWEEALEAALVAAPRAALGECGLHHGGTAPLAAQTTALRSQLALAVRLRRPATLHCVRAFGPLLDELQASAPTAGFRDTGLLLHSYSGSVATVPRLVALGAHFSFSATVASVAPERAAALLRAVPDDRLLLETDAPDGLPRRGAALPPCMAELRHAPPPPGALAFSSPRCGCADEGDVGGCSRAEHAAARGPPPLNHPVRVVCSVRDSAGTVPAYCVRVLRRQTCERCWQRWRSCAARRRRNSRA